MTKPEITKKTSTPSHVYVLMNFAASDDRGPEK